MLIKLLMARPMNKARIAEAIGIETRKMYMWVSPMIEDFHDHGMIYIEGWIDCVTPLYRWSPVPFANSDAPRPEKKYAPCNT